MRGRRTPLYLAALTALITLIVYLPSLRNGFVNWDDSVNVIDNLHIRSLGLAFLKWAFTDVTVSYWQPVVWISHAADYALWGLNPFGHHLTNLVLHGLNTFLVVLLVFRLFEAAKASRLRSVGPPLPDERFGLVAAGVTGLLFGIHPLHVESVAWVTGRKDLLSTLFFLVTLLAWLRYAGGRGWTGTGAFLKDRRYLASLLLFILALASKPMVVTLPVVLLLLDWYPLERIAGRKDLVPSLIEKIPFLAPSLALSAVTVWSHRALGVVKSLNEVSLLARLESAARAAVFYLVKMVLPLHLSPYYPDPKAVPVLSFGYLGGLALVAALTAACLFLAKRRRFLFPAVWSYYLVTLLPVAGIVKTTSLTVADRFTYLPGIGPFLLLGLASAVVWERAEWKGRGFRRAAAATAVVLCLVLTVLTVRQIGVWRDGYTLWNFVIGHSTDRISLAYQNRATALAEIGRSGRALADYSTAIFLDPFSAEAYNDRGKVLGDTGMLDSAIDDFTRAIALDPGSYTAYTNRGTAYRKTGRFRLALKDFAAAIERDPQRSEAYYQRGIALRNAGRFDEAAADLSRAAALDPWNSSLYNERAMAFAGAGRLDQAIGDFDRAIGLDPGFAAAYLGRGDCYREQGDAARARSDYQKACALGEEAACEALRGLVRR